MGRNQLLYNKNQIIKHKHINKHNHTTTQQNKTTKKQKQKKQQQQKKNKKQLFCHCSLFYFLHTSYTFITHCLLYESPWR